MGCFLGARYPCRSCRTSRACILGARVGIDNAQRELQKESIVNTNTLPARVGIGNALRLQCSDKRGVCSRTVEFNQIFMISADTFSELKTGVSEVVWPGIAGEEWARQFRFTSEQRAVTVTRELLYRSPSIKNCFPKVATVPRKLPPPPEDSLQVRQPFRIHRVETASMLRIVLPARRGKGSQNCKRKSILVSLKQDLLITRPARSQTKTPCGGCCSTRSFYVFDQDVCHQNNDNTDLIQQLCAHLCLRARYLCGAMHC